MTCAASCPERSCRSQAFASAQAAGSPISECARMIDTPSSRGARSSASRAAASSCATTLCPSRPSNGSDLAEGVVDLPLRPVQLRRGRPHAEQVHARRPTTHAIDCVECKAISSSPKERGWRGYRYVDAELEVAPALVFYCPRCAAAEFGPPAPPRPEINRGRRHRDAHAGGAATYRIALETVVTPLTTDSELAAAFDALAAAGATDLAVVADDAEHRRIEFDLEAQNH